MTSVTFTSLLWVWQGEGAGRWHFLTVPEAQSAEIKAHAFGMPRGFGSVRVEARFLPSTISGQAVVWRTSVFPLSEGGYLLPVKADVRKRSAIVAGGEVTVTLELL